MKITKKWLINHGACQPGLDYFDEQREDDAKKLFELAIMKKEFGYVNWVLTEKFTKKQNLMYVIFSAEQVLPIFENEFTDDKRPREAIEAAKECLKSPTKKNRDAARAAARAASAAAYAADAAACAADAARAAACDAAIAAKVAKEKIYIKILNYGFDLLRGMK